MTIQAPAKVNLVLRVFGKRPDGFHDIETLMVPISLADELDITVSSGEGMEISCDEPGVPVDSRNLVWRAVEVFARHTALVFRTRMDLRKSIPHGAGLGGGSSDAAAVLKALDVLHNTRLGNETLEQLASHIGSDVPFFIRGRASWCRGRGEMMEDAGVLPSLHLLLLKPPFPVSTAWAYGHKTFSVPHPPQVFGELEFSNDLEAPVFSKHLLLPVMKSWLLEQAEVEVAMMSGSGSTMFAVLRGNPDTLARRAKAQFGESLWTSECRTV